MRTRLPFLIITAGLVLALAGCNRHSHSSTSSTTTTPPKTAAVAPAAAAPLVAGVKVKNVVLARGLNYLVKTQGKNGSWMPFAGPAVTALAVKALVQAGVPATNPVIVKAMKFIEATHQPDGGFYMGNALQNYNTCIVLSTLAVLPRKEYQKQITEAQHYLISLQRVGPMKNNKGQVITPKSGWYGGVGYGTGRPDLSNTSFFISALRDSGLPASNPAIQRALVFVSHCQEDSETNPMPFARGLHNGGFIYSAADGGLSSAGNRDQVNGPPILSAYGSMTYAGLKSMVYAGLSKNSRRVKAAIEWIRGHWTLNYNPGTGESKEGLFYYYLMFGKAFHALGIKTLTDVNGIKHNWRRELTAKLASLQRKDGSWKNIWSTRWLEFNPQLVTCYACLDLEAAGQ